MWKLYFDVLKKIFFVFILLLLLIHQAKALGTLQKKSYLETAPGQVAEFGILIWNTEPIEVEFKEKVVPKNWSVIIEPRKFVLDANTGSDIISLPEGYVKALLVKIFVIIPTDADPGIYGITVGMTAGKTEKGISFFQEKNFNFKVNISGHPAEKKELVSVIANVSGNFTAAREAEKAEPLRLVFWLLIVTVLLIIGWIVYKL